MRTTKIRLSPAALMIASWVAALAVILASSPSGYASPSVANPTPLTFAPYQLYSTNPRQPQSVAIGDFTGDGRNDVALGVTFNGFATQLLLYVQQPDRTLGVPIAYSVHGGGYDSMSMAVADLNNDGLTDLALANVSGVDVFYQQAGTLAQPVLVTHDLAGDVDVGDLNHDGYNDIVETGNHDVRVALGTGSGFGASSLIYSGDVYETELGDVTGDGALDIVSTNGDKFYVFTSGAPYGPSTFAYSTGAAPFYGGIEVADVTGDGRMDVLATLNGNNPFCKLEVFRQNLAGTLDAPVQYATLDIPDPVEAADMNGDGLKDIAIAHGGYLKAGVYLQKTDGTLGNESLYALPYTTRYRVEGGLAIGDINSDGAPDLAVASNNDGLVVLRQVVQSTPSPTGPPPIGGLVELPTSNGG